MKNDKMNDEKRNDIGYYNDEERKNIGYYNDEKRNDIRYYYNDDRINDILDKNENKINDITDNNDKKKNDIDIIDDDDKINGFDNENNNINEINCYKEEEEKMECCVHESICLEGSNKICTSCGIILEKETTYEKEWRFYGNSSSRHQTNPNRCTARYVHEKSIMKDVQKLGFSDKIIQLANEIYSQTTQGHIYRGNTRKGIIFACFFHAYKLNENPHSCEQLMEIFQIERKIALKGIKFINLHIAKDDPLRHLTVDTEHIIIEIMNKFYANSGHIEDVLDIYCSVKEKTPLLKRSRPRSVASGVVRYYIFKKNPSISTHYFCSKINLSEMTVLRIVKEIASLLGDTMEWKTLSKQSSK